MQVFSVHDFLHVLGYGSRMRSGGTPLALGLALLGISGCDPVLEDRIAQLGPETPGVRPGPFHRPGQPCLACHGEGGRARPQLSVAGTVYRDPADTRPVDSAEVILIDATQARYTATTNCVGNFFVTPGDFAPVLPLWTTVRLGTFSIDMESAVHLNGDCASCHTDPLARASAGHVFLTDDPALIGTVPEARCN